MYLVAGNIICQRIADGTLVKVPMNTYDSRTYVNLFKVCAELNEPHLTRILELFAWIDNGKTTKLLLADELLSLLPKKAAGAIDKDAVRQEKALYLIAYNSYFNVVYQLTDILKDN